jgi:hypothetical protein
VILSFVYCDRSDAAGRQLAEKLLWVRKEAENLKDYGRNMLSYI